MKPALNVVYRNLDTSATLNDIIDKRIDKLARYSHHILFSRIVLDAPHQHKHKGKMYRASLELDMNGQGVTIAQNDESIHVAVRDVFKSAERKVKQLEDRLRDI